MRPYNQWFYSDMDYLKNNMKNIMKNIMIKIKAWLYGHTHRPSKQVIKGIHLLCNPIGYPGENKGLDFQASFTQPKIED